MLKPLVVSGAPACDSELASPAPAAGDVRKNLDFAHGPGEHRDLEKFLSCAFPYRSSSSGGESAPRTLDARRPGARYIQLPHTRLVVVHEKYWLAILHKDKLVEFRSSKQPILVEAGQCLLFALAMRLRRSGKDALISARVLKVELLHVDHARETYPRESDGCDLTDLAAKWGVDSVRCIVLDKDSIRMADEIANLSKGC